VLVGRADSVMSIERAVTDAERRGEPFTLVLPSQPTSVATLLTRVNTAISNAGLTGRLTGFIWRTIGPFFERQLTFNSLLVDHLNRTAAAARESTDAAQQVIASLDERRSPPDEFEVRGQEIYLCCPNGVGGTKLTNAYFDAKLSTMRYTPPTADNPATQSRWASGCAARRLKSSKVRWTRR